MYLSKGEGEGEREHESDADADDDDESSDAMNSHRFVEVRRKRVETAIRKCLFDSGEGVGHNLRALLLHDELDDFEVETQEEVEEGKEESRKVAVRRR